MSKLWMLGGVIVGAGSASALLGWFALRWGKSLERAYSAKTIADYDVWEAWSKASAKNVLFFALIWFGEGFLFLLFMKPGSAFSYFFGVVWTSFGLLLTLRPHWFTRTMRAVTKELERLGENLEKRPPPGFP